MLPPRATQWLPNPSQSLDFRRFWSAELLAAFCEQRDEIRRHPPAAPVTTNFTLPGYQVVDAWEWSREVDVVAVDHYLGSPGEDGHTDIAFCGDRARSWGEGRPWLLMEQATSLIYQPDRVLAKPEGRMLRDSVGYLARGADSLMFFQWRASPAGAEMFHPAMVPHAGPGTRIFREVTALGRAAQKLAEIAGSTLTAPAALVWDPQSWWALEHTRFTSAGLQYLDVVRAFHAALWRAGVTCDFSRLDQDLTRYRLVVAPLVCVLGEGSARALRGYVAGGGHVLMSFFSGMTDGRYHAHLGGTPGGLLDVFGIRAEEFCPLRREETVTLSGVRGLVPPGGWTGRVWSERLRAEGAAVTASYASGMLAGLPAVTRNSFRAGTAWYVSTWLDTTALDGLMPQVLAGAGAAPELAGLPPGVEVTRRHRDGQSWLFVLNHTGAPVRLPAEGTELLSGQQVTGCLEAGAGEVAVVRERGTPGAGA